MNMCPEVVELARLCSLDIGRKVEPEEVQRFFSIGEYKLGDPTWAFERFNTEDVSDIVATIIKETPNVFGTGTGSDQLRANSDAAR